uniref:Uncharacterized protein n=1 Tax=Arion vulgaris TaxID=1028688 RepID=A0A0B6ZY02_9EUPU
MPMFMVPISQPYIAKGNMHALRSLHFVPCHMTTALKTNPKNEQVTDSMINKEGLEKLTII